MLNIYEQVDQNKRRSAIIIVFFIAFVTGFVWLVSYLFNTSQTTIVWAVLFSSFSAVTSYFWGDKIILSLSGAKTANRNKYFNFYTAAENLSLAAQVPMPKLYVINSPALNAFATGRNPENAIICATTGLIENLNKSEIEAVVAHEMSHIVNYDILIATLVALLVGMISVLADWILRASRFGLNKNEDRNQKNSNPVVMVISIFTFLVSPLIGKLIQLALSRRREYLADAWAVKLTRQPEGLINALKKLAENQIPLTTANEATAHLYIVNPFSGRGIQKINTLFSTHPPLVERIAMLQKMM